MQEVQEVQKGCRVAAVRGKPIFVARDAADAELESARRAVEASLNEVTARAYGLLESER